MSVEEKAGVLEIDGRGHRLGLEEVLGLYVVL